MLFGNNGCHGFTALGKAAFFDCRVTVEDTASPEDSDAVAQKLADRRLLAFKSIVLIRVIEIESDQIRTELDV